jgi:hypothetical protein
MCMAPLQLRGIKGKKSTPSVHWEVSVKSHWLTSERCTERMGQRLRVVDSGYDTLSFILQGRLLFTLHFHFGTFDCVKKMLT